MTQVLFLARSLDLGGAERQMVQLARGLKARGHDVGIALFYAGGPLQSLAEASGVAVHDLGKRGRYDVLGPVLRLARLVRRLRPDILHGYLAVPNALAWLVTRLCPGPRLVFGVRASDMELARYDSLSRLSYRLEAVLASDADLVIANSHAGLSAFRARGFRGEGVVIPNGIDTDHFRPDREQRVLIRRELGIGDGERVIGLVGRLDPMKDHGTFLEAAVRLLARHGDLRFVCAGSGPAATREGLCRQVRDMGLESSVIWLDGVPDPAPLYNGFDLLVSSSAFGEGFSNVIAEAMACDVPVVASRVGDAARIIGDDARLVSPRDALALSVAMEAALDSPPAAGAARQRIVETFSADRLAQDSEAALAGLLAPQVLHVITDLDTGGAERMLQRLVLGAAGPERHRIVSLKPGGALRQSLVDAGIPVHHLDMRRRLPSPLALWRLVRLIRRARPAVVMTWLYHADLMGTVAARLAGFSGRLVWNLRCSAMELEHYHPVTRMIRGMLARLSTLPDMVTVNSASGRTDHQRLGYTPRAWRLIPNGVDSSLFRPDPEARARIRGEWGMGEDMVVAGVVARWDPMKDHAGFLEAVTKAASPPDRVVLLGRGMDDGNGELVALVRRLGLADQALLLGERADVPAVMSGLDILVSASAFGEGFPNVLIEAMATGVPCIATDVGDSAVILGNAGLVVPPRRPEALARALSVLVADRAERKRLADHARDRVEAHWGLEHSLAEFKEVWATD